MKLVTKSRRITDRRTRSRRTYRARNRLRDLRLESLEDRRMLATVNWDGGGDGTSWENPLNWDTDALPTSADDVNINVIASNPTIQVGSGAHTIRSLTTEEAVEMTGGSLTINTSSVLNNSLTNNGGDLSLVGGTISGTAGIANDAGTLTLRGVTLDVGLTNATSLTTGSTVSLNGTVTNQAAGLLQVLGGLSSHATLNLAMGIQNDGTVELINTGGGFTSTINVTGGVFTNNEILRSSEGFGSGTRTVIGNVDNFDTIDVDYNLTINNNGATLNSQTGTFNVAAPATLLLDRGTRNLGTGSNFVGGGLIDFSQGIVELQSNVVVAAGTPTWGFPNNVTINGAGTLTNQQAGMTMINETVNVDLINAGTLITGSTVSLNGTVTNQAAGLLQVLGGLSSHATLNLAMGIQNDGTVELINTGGGFNSTINVNGGVFTNNEILRSSEGFGGGTRTVIGNVDNFDTIDVDYNLTINNNGATLNSQTGTFNVAAPATLLLDRGTRNLGTGSNFVGGGLIDFSQGIVELQSNVVVAAGTPTWGFPNNVTINGAGTLTNQQAGMTMINETVNVDLINAGTLITGSTVSLNGTVTNQAAGLLQVLGGLFSHATLNLAMGIQNDGTVELINTGGSFNSTINVNGGVFTNNEILRSSEGFGGGTRTVIGNVDNFDTIDVDYNLTINNNGATLNSQTGTFNVAAPATLLLDRGTRNLGTGSNFVGGGLIDFSQGIVELQSNVVVAAGTPTWGFPNNVTINGAGTLTNQQAGMTMINETVNVDLINAGTLTTGATVSLNGTVTNQAAGLLQVLGGLSSTATLNLAMGIQNDGTVELINTGGGFTSTINVTGGVFTNNEILRSSEGFGGGTRIVIGNVDNFDTIDVDYNLTINNNGATLNSQTGTFNVAAPATLLLDRGTRNLGTGSNFVGDGLIDFNGGIVELQSNVVVAAGTPTWGFPNNVTINGAGTLTNQQAGMTMINETVNVDLINAGTLTTGATVSLNGTVTNQAAGLLQVLGGLFSHATLNLAMGIQNDGTVELINTGGGFTSTVNVNGGVFTNNEILRSSEGFGGGLRIVTGNVDNFDTIDVDYNLTINNNGAMPLTNAGHIDIELGSLTVTDDYIQSLTGQLTLYIFAQPTTAGVDWTQLDVDGDVILAGAFHIERDPGFIPTFGTLYPEIPLSATRVGGFDTFSGTDAGGGNVFVLQYRPDGFDVVVDLNDPPVASDDSLTLDEGATTTTLDGGVNSVLSNDSDPNLPGDSLTVNTTPVSGPSHGMLMLNSDGTFSYTHDGSENFTDSFVYELSDNTGATDSATVTITINPINDNVPIPVNDSLTVTNGGTATTLTGGAISLLDNDQDDDLPQDTLTVNTTPVTGPSHGMITLLADGTFSYTHDGSATFNDQIEYEVIDANGATNTGFLNVAINDPPVAQADFATADKSNSITIAILDNDFDLDSIDTLTVSSVNTTATQGLATLNPNGTVDYDPDGQFDYLTLGQEAQDTFTYEISDGRGGSAQATVTVTVIYSDAARPDVTLISSDITFSPINPDPLQFVQISATIHNQGFTQADGPFFVVFKKFGDQIGSAKPISNLAAGESRTVLSDFASFADVGFKLITVEIDTTNEVNESNEFNNQANAVLQVGQPPAPDATINVTVNDAMADEGQFVTVTGSGFYDFDIVPGQNDYPTKGAVVTLQVVDDMGPTEVVLATYHGARTNTNGDWSQTILAPLTAGNYKLKAAITDFSVSGDDDARLVVNTGVAPPAFVPPTDPPPAVDSAPGQVIPGNGCLDCGGGGLAGGPGSDPSFNNAFLYAEHIFPSDFNPDLGEEIFVFVYFYYAGLDPAFNLPVQLRDIFPVGDPAQLMPFTIGNAQVSFPSGGSDSPQIVVFPWTNTAEGAHILEAGFLPGVQAIVPTNNPLDDNATRLFSVGPPQGDLTVDKSAVFTVDADGNTVISPGDTVQYSVEITNSGNTNLTGIRIHDDFPEGLVDQISNVSLGGIQHTLPDGNQVLMWDIASLPAGGSLTVTYDLVVAAAIDIDINLGNVVIVSSDQKISGFDSLAYPIRTNQAPNVDDDFVSTDEDNVLTVPADGVLGNDSDPNPTDVLTVIEVNGSTQNVGLPVLLSSGVVVTINANGSYVVDPNGQFESLQVGQSIVDAFTYTASDGNGGTAIAIVTITIDGVNDGPVAMDDTAMTDEDNAVTVLANGVLANDTDVDAGDTKTVSEVDGVAANVGTQITLGSGALLTLNADGSFSYDPNGQFDYLQVGDTATDSFTYTIVDSQGATDTATVVITIDGVNDGPVAVDDTAMTDEDNPVTVLASGVLANDTDVDAGDTKTVSEVNGVAANVGMQITLGSGALLTLNADGSFSYDPNGQFEYLQVGDTATDSFTYTMVDSQGTTDTATVVVTIDGVNDGPVAMDDTAMTDEDNAVTVPANGVLANDTDVDAGDTKTVSEVNGVAANVGTQITLGSGALLTFNADGSFSYDPNGQFEYLQVSDTATDSFTYTMVDSQGATDTATVVVTIDGVNDGPVAMDDTAMTDEDNAVTVLANGVLANDTDVDAGDTKTVSEVNGVAANVGMQITLGSGALLTLNADGSFSYDPNGQFEYLQVSDTATDSFTYAMVDSQGATDTATVVVTIDGVNDGPVAMDDTAMTDEDNAVTVLANGVLANDTDVDAGDTKTVSEVNGVAANVGTQITLGSGALLTLNADGSFSYDPNGQFEYLQVGDTATDSFTYTMVDSQGATDTATVVVTIDGVNDGPVAMDDTAMTDEDNAVTVPANGVLANDTDVDAGDTKTVSEVNGVAANVGTQITLGSGALLTLNADGSFSYDPNGQFEYLQVGDTATDSFTYAMVDSQGATDTATVNITIHGVNDGTGTNAISGRVFDDRDNDGAFETLDGDTGLEGVLIELWNQVAGTLVSSTTTDVDGIFVFENVSPGTYRLVQMQPDGYLDGNETAGTVGGTVDNSQDDNEIRDIVLTNTDALDNLFADILPSTLQGLVWEDFNNDGTVDFGELAMEGVMITLTGTDDRGNNVSQVQHTESQGIFEFIDLRPGEYTITETQPVGYVDGKDVVGEVNGVLNGDNDGGTPALSTSTDAFSSVVLPAPGSSGVNYNFGDRIDSGSLGSGQTATIGFWQNKNGKALVENLNGSTSSTLLAEYLGSTFPHMYGVNAGPSNLLDSDGNGVSNDPYTNLEVHALYTVLFKRNNRTSPGGPPKLDAQVMAVAMATYVTKESLVSVDFVTGAVNPSLVTTVENIGFQVTVGGLGSQSFNVGNAGAAFGVADNSNIQIIDLLLATNSMATHGLLYDVDGDGEIDSYEQMMRALANDVFTAINELGHI